MTTETAPSNLSTVQDKRAMRQVGQTRSGLVEDALVIAGGIAIVSLAVRGSKSSSR